MRETLARVAATFGTPCFVYFLDQIELRIREIEEAFGGRFEISFAAKSNPNPGIVSWLRGRTPWLDISSAGELRLGLRSGWEASRMSFTGPGKTPAILAEACAAGVGEVVLESIREAEDLSAVAISTGVVQDVLVRVAPTVVPKGFGDWMAGKPSQFGIDEEVAEAAVERIAALPGIRLIGFHAYSGTQCLRVDSLAENYRIFATIFRRLSARVPTPMRKLVFGAGIGIPYHDKDVPVRLGELAAATNPMLDELRAEPKFGEARFLLETGRFLVGEAGCFLVKVIHRKETRGAVICVCDGGMNFHMSAAGRFGMVTPRNYRMIKVVGAEGPEGVFQLTGPLCTSLDSFGRDVRLPELRIGDVIALLSSGAYGLSASPHGFISHDRPKEILVSGRAGAEHLADVTLA